MKTSANSSILLIEDDQKLADLIQRSLKREGYDVTVAFDGEEGKSYLLKNKYDLLITDLMLPKLDGISLINQIKPNLKDLPILILSAKTSVDERVLGLRSGADDYVSKPFAFDELIARVEALLRRTKKENTPTELQVANLRMDLLSGKVYRDAEEIILQPQEYALLLFLMKNRGRVVTRSMIIKQVWNYNIDPLTNVVESRICLLRNKIDKPFSPKLIQTIRGYGYALRLEK